MDLDNYQDDVCQFFTEPNIGIDTNVVDNSINCLILNKASRETDKFEVPPFLWSMETNTIHRSPFTGYTRLLYSVPMHQGFRWEVSRIHIKGSYFGSDTTAELDVEARYLGRSIFLNLLASLEMVFRSGFFSWSMTDIKLGKASIFFTQTAVTPPDRKIPVTPSLSEPRCWFRLWLCSKCFYQLDIRKFVYFISECWVFFHQWVKFTKYQS